MFVEVINVWRLVESILIGLLALVLVGGGIKWLNSLVYEWCLGKEKRRQLPQGDLGWPVIGNMRAFFKAFESNDPDAFMNSYHNRFNKIGIYKAFMFGNPTIMITLPDVCKQILMDDEHYVPGWPKSTNELIGRKSFLFLSVEDHKRLRRLTSAPVNGYDSLTTYLQFIEKTVISSLEKWAEMGEIEFLTELRRFTFRIIIKIFLTSATEEMMWALEKVYTDLNHGMRALAINFPGFAYHRALKARKKLVEVLQGIIDERRALRRNNIFPTEKDMMDNLLDTKDEIGRKLDDDEIIDVLIMYLNAGHESSGHITMWATVFLLENPECYKEAKEEQEEIRKNMGASGLTLKDFRRMEYLSQVIDETLRLVNISFVSFREPKKDMYIKGYLVPKGWKVELWYRSVHMDNQIYIDPKKFDPSRWNRNFTPRAGTFIPFGGGSRLCPGNELAKLEISVFLHYFLLGYKLTRTNPLCPIRYLPHSRPTDNCKAIITKISQEM